MLRHSVCKISTESTFQLMCLLFLLVECYSPPKKEQGPGFGFAGFVGRGVSGIQNSNEMRIEDLYEFTAGAIGSLQPPAQTQQIVTEK